ncbi:MAG TPA: tyrosine-type recombinase/integrase [Conexibacter sp.]|nr:tyrosine-type recombinase/integrase [Conexibacter sp.]
MIEKRSRRGRDGKAYTVYRVRWYDAAGVERSLSFPRKTKLKDVEGFESRVKLLKRTGELAVLDQGRETLADFAEYWWQVHAGPNLAAKTLEVYAGIWNKHLLPRIGSLTLREISPEVVATLRAALERDKVGAPTIRKGLSLLQGMLQRAVEWGRIAHNPVVGVRKPRAPRQTPIVVLAPARVEQLRGELLGQGRRMDATMVAALAYSGPRPGELLSLRWQDIRERTLIYHPTKTGQDFRTVRLLGPLRQDLLEWRLAQGGAGPGDLVFPVDDAGGEWADHDYRNWRKRIFRPAAAAAGLELRKPYDLRHAFASLLIHEGKPVTYVAEQLGHSPQMTWSTYAHVIQELDGEPHVPASDAIRAARDRGLGHQATLGAM